MKKAEPKKKSPATKRPADKKHVWGLALVLVLVWIVYSGSRNGEFLNWDDNDIVLDNSAVKHMDASNAARVFTQFYSGDYRPLTILVYGLVHHFFGLNPKAYHTLNLLLHLLNVFLVFVLYRRLTEKKYLPIIGAALWGLHPMLSESVSWISGMNDMLYASFFFGGLILYLYYLRQGKSWRTLIPVFICYVCSLLAKPHAIVFPVLLFVIDHFKNEKLDLKNAMPKIPFFLLAFAFAGITVYGRTLEPEISANAFHFGQRIFFAFYIFNILLFKVFLPFQLSALHEFPAATAPLPVLFYLMPVFFFLLIFFVFKMKSIRKMLLFGLLFYAFNIVAVLQIIPFGTFLYAERYCYVAYSGLIFALLSLPEHLKLRQRLGNLQLGLFAFALVLLFSLLTYDRSKVWKDNFSLWTDVLNKNPNSFTALNNLGLAHYEAGNMHDAWQCFNKVLEIDAENTNALLNRGNVTLYLGNFVSAEKDFTAAIKINPSNQTAYNNRANTRVYTKNFEGALEDYNKAIALSPDYLDALFNRGLLFSELGASDSAIRDFEQIIKINPYHINAYFNRAEELRRQMRYDEAIRDLDAVIRINPEIAEAYFNKGMIYMNTENNTDAADNFRKALSINPNYGDAYFNVGVVNLKLKYIEEACVDFRKAHSMGVDASEQINAFCN